MRAQRSAPNELILGLVSVSDRASRGAYEDEGIPALKEWISSAVTTPVQFHERLIADEQFDIEKTLRELVDDVGCDLVFTTGGTGPARRDVTPEATLAVGTREMPGFGEQMRRISLNFVPTAILSRQVAVLREIPDHAALIVNLPGRPKSISETLGGCRDAQGRVTVAGLFASIPYCIDLIGGPRIETDAEIIEAFRPKSKSQPAAPASFTSSLPRATSTVTSAPQPAPAPAAANAAPKPAASKPSASSYEGFALTRPLEIASPADMPRAGLGNRTDHAYAVPNTAAPRPSMTAEAIARRSVQHRPQTVVAQRQTGGVPMFGARQNGIEPLELFVKEPEGNQQPACTVIWLHGLGADAHDFESLPEQLREYGAPAARFIFPNAPERELTMQPGHPVRSWYDILRSDFVSEEDLPGLAKMHLRISQIINSIVSSGLLAERIFLGGFSQGGAMALYSTLRQARTLAGCISLSGYLPAPQLLAHDATPGGRATPIYMGHGSFDHVINPLIAQKGADAVEKCADTLIWREYDMDHELCPEELAHVAQFINTALQN